MSERVCERERESERRKEREREGRQGVISLSARFYLAPGILKGWQRGK